MIGLLMLEYGFQQVVDVVEQGDDVEFMQQFNLFCFQFFVKFKYNGLFVWEMVGQVVYVFV